MSLLAVDIEVTENNDAEVEIALSSTLDGVTTPTDLTGSSLEFYAKTDVAQTDASAPVKYTTASGTIGILGVPTDGRILIYMTRADLATPGEYPYHLDRIKAGKRLTVLYGKLRVVNV